MMRVFGGREVPRRWSLVAALSSRRSSSPHANSSSGRSATYRWICPTFIQLVIRQRHDICKRENSYEMQERDTCSAVT
jgi:hypothetical protein